MSTSNVYNLNDNNSPKFTRGEKCIFIHIVVTFVLILIVVLTYLVHLYVVDHTWYDVFIISTKPHKHYPHKHAAKTAPNIPIGIAYLNVTPPVLVCNTILIRQSWSIAPGRCVAIRSEPDMAYLFFSWRLKYTSNSEIIRSIVHPQFNGNTLANNIGLFQHTSEDKKQNLLWPISSINLNDLQNSQDLFIGSWDGKMTIENGRNNIKYHQIHIMTPELCSKYISPIMNVRIYEYCVTFSEKQDIIIEHGAVTIANNKIVGIFSWGEKNEKFLPFVILNVSYFEDWILYETFQDLT